MAWVVERRLKSGSIVEHVQWKEGGKTRSRSTGGRDRRRTADLLEWAQAREGRPSQPADLHTPQDALDAFLKYQRLRGVVGETIRWYHGKLDALVAAWADIPMGRWSRPHLELYLHERRDAGWSDSTFNGLLTACTAWIGWAKEVDAPFGDFVGGIRRAKVERRKVEVLTEAQVFDLIDAAGPLSIRTFLALAGLTGIRRSEILRLTWEDVDFRRGELRVRGKTREGRIVDIHDRLREVLLEEPGVSGHVLRTHRHSTALYHGLKVAYKAAKLPYPKGRPLHALRGALTTNLIEKGAPLTVVRDILGHSNIRTTSLYGESRPAARRNALKGYGS